MTETINRKHKDSVFSLLFSDKSKLIELYNAIEGTRYAFDTEIEINTLENVLYLDRINDVSFTIDGKLVVLVEHQSTVNENMPLRCLLYIAKIYEKILDHKKIYAARMLGIPRPEFIVLYNGERPYPDRKTLRLSDAYKEKNADIWLELTVTVYNINSGRNQEIIQKSETLKGYVQFISYVKANIKEGLSPEEAISKAVKHCIDNDILSGFLKIHGSEVRNMLFTEFNMDDAIKVWREEGREEGLELAAFGMLSVGLSDAQIKQILKITDEKLAEIKEKHLEETLTNK